LVLPFRVLITTNNKGLLLYSNSNCYWLICSNRGGMVLLHAQIVTYIMCF
jgi:hypothetical protein